MSVKPASDADWQRLWFTTRQHGWNSLAIIPNEAGVDAARVAESLVAMGRLCADRPVTLLNARGATLANVHELVDSLGAMTGRGEWVIVPVDPIEDSPSAVPIVLATSAALLVVRLGESLLTSARAAIEAVGRERFLGSIVLEDNVPANTDVVQPTE